MPDPILFQGTPIPRPTSSLLNLKSPWRHQSAKNCLLGPLSSTRNSSSRPTTTRENLLKYLTYDSDAAERIVLNDILELGVNMARSARLKTWRLTTADQMGKIVKLIAAFDEDGEAYEEIEMAVTLAFTKNNKRYYSNGLFAIEATAVIIEQAELASLFARITKED